MIGVHVGRQRFDEHGTVLAMPLGAKSGNGGVGEKEICVVRHHRTDVFSQRGIVRIGALDNTLNVGPATGLQLEMEILKRNWGQFSK